MAIFDAHNIGYTFANGDTLFSNISCTMDKHRIGLIGRNGIGKSILSAILSGDISPSSGKVSAPSNFSIFTQERLTELEHGLTIAEYLEKHHILNALKHVQMGSCLEKWFEIIDQDWELESQLKQDLANLGLPPEPSFLCNELSGGQFTRLALWKRFRQSAELLILDEPSNHLDNTAKQWLIESMNVFSGAILLISHDRELLNQVEEIWQLSTTGLQVFGGNYDFYESQKYIEQQSIDKQLVNINRQKKQLDAQTQRNIEKAQQRAAKSNKLRRRGSQGKMLLNKMKESAENSLSNRSKLSQIKKTQLQCRERQLTTQQDRWKSQTFNVSSCQQTSNTRVLYLDGQLAFGTKAQLNLQLFSKDKIHLQGPNGCGKSTLLQTLSGKLSLSQGDVSTTSRFCYLDQHLTIIDQTRSVLDNFCLHVNGNSECSARTVLAGMGFRGDDVFKYAESLSGGEKIKLAMLIVSHHPKQPFLLLDEPDNHLDIDSKAILANALNDYQGGFLLVTHDCAFAHHSGVQQSYCMDHQGFSLTTPHDKD